MAMTIELRISGLAIFYKIANLWQVVFVCDSTHPANFRHGGAADWTPLHKNNMDRDISIYVDNPIAPASMEGPAFNRILNMARAEMHGRNKLKIKRTGTTKMVFMTIPNAELDMAVPTPKDYYILNPNGALHNIGPVAKTIKAVIKLNNGNGLTMIVKDGDATTRLAAVPYTEGGNYVFEFNNDCGEMCKDVNDFILFYEWLKDAGDETRKFLAGKITVSLAERMKTLAAEEEEPSVSTQHSLLMSENGNCDPVVVEPPPN